MGNPIALQMSSPTCGTPIVVAYKPRTAIVNMRSMAAGYAGVDNELFYLDKTMMVFGMRRRLSKIWRRPLTRRGEVDWRR
jgi:NAD/NADP transhydrogenase beta subunit